MLLQFQPQQILVEELISKFMTQLSTLVLSSQTRNIKLHNKNKENSTQPVEVLTQLAQTTTVSRETLEPNTLITMPLFFNYLETTHPSGLNFQTAPAPKEKSSLQKTSSSDTLHSTPLPQLAKQDQLLASETKIRNEKQMF